jgi:hypothetical protein
VRANDLLAGRFELLAPAGSGGMGEVWRARDRVAGVDVAVKRMLPGRGSDGERFLREARLLSEVVHPGFVRYVGHGIAQDGTPFLAMEWLEGRTLQARLDDGPLSVQESVDLARRTADALSAAHAVGIVHRDIKPSNLFLVDGRTDRPKVLDFGLARPVASRLTRTGGVVGTVGYMAPEQALGRELDARVDVFALGCVLFECLTGRAAFVGEHQAAVLCKVLLDDVPRPSDVAASVPADLEALVMRLLAKTPADRPADAREVVVALDALAPLERDFVAASERRSSGPRLGASERRWLSVLLVAGTDPRTTLVDTHDDRAPDSDSPAIADVVAPLGGEVVRLVDGSIVVTVRGLGPPDEQAVRAARCALAVRRARPRAVIAVAAGGSDSSTGVFAGEVIDRAVALLDRGPGVHVDEQTEHLLRGRFVVHAGALDEEIGASDQPRPLLGKATRCVGRDKELALLQATLAETVDEPGARLVLVMGGPGVGKTRLRQELVNTPRVRDDMHVLIARGDPVYAGSAFGLARQLVRFAARGDGLAAHVSSLGLGDARPRVLEFLGELVGARALEPSPLLRAARNDALVMGEQFERAFVQWIEALCRARPLLLVLEDLHWGDGPTVGWITTLLRRLATAPLAVLAVGRPETRTLFPVLWSVPGAHEIGLSALGRRAAEQLVRNALPEVRDEVVARIVDRADGNAFFLEELARHVAQRDSAEELPPTVLAMAQARLEHLDPDSRRVLRAASIFGEAFWEDSLRPLVGAAIDLDAHLQALVAGELLGRARAARFSGHHEYTFRHGLLRDAAYALLTDTDRQLGHRLAAQWLEDAGERDDLVLADHFERGGAPARALPHLVDAAQTAVTGDAADLAMTIVSRGLACGAEGEAYGMLMQIRTQAHLLRHEPDLAVVAADAARSNLERGSPAWCRTVGAIVYGASITGDLARVALALQELIGTPVPREPTGPYGAGLFMAVMGLLTSGQTAMAREFLAMVEAAAAGESTDPVAAAWMLFARAHCDDGPGLHLVLRANAEFHRVGERNGETLTSYEPVFAYVQLGMPQRALEVARAAAARIADAPAVTMWSQCTLGLALGALGRPQESALASKQVLEGPDPFGRGTARAAVALGWLRSGALAELASDADALAKEWLPGMVRVGETIRAWLAHREGRHADAVVHAARALASGSPLRTTAVFEPILRLVHAEALHAAGDRAGALAAIVAARARILDIAGSIPEVELRDSFLGNVPENARTLELAAAWDVGAS